MNLKVHEDKTRGVYIEDLSERYVSDESEVYELMRIGLDNREVASTNMNAGSSRSHSIFLITIAQTDSKDYVGKTGKLYLVDLAGSEKVGKTGAAGKRLEEAKNINKSLTALGLVINSLTDGKSTHIPYRDSKLTRVLQDSLGGNSKTSLIVTCSPSPFNEAETISTLRFGIRAKSIKNKPKINKEHTLAEMKILLARSEEEIEKRNKIIAELQENLKKSGGDLPDFSLSFRLGDEEKKVNYEEILQEIENLMQKLSEEVEKNAKEKEKNKALKLELDESKKITLQHVGKLDQLQNNMVMAESAVKEQENLIQKLVLSKENLEGKVEEMVKAKIAFDKILNDKDTEISQLKQQLILNPSPQPKSQSDRLQLLSSELYQEQQNSNLLKQKIVELEASLDEVLNSHRSSHETNEKYHENALRREREKWQREQQGLLKDLSNRINKVVELEMDLDSLRESYKALEGTLSIGERALRRKNESLEKSLEQLINDFQKMSSRNDKCVTDIQFLERKYKEEWDRRELVERLHKDCDTKMEDYELRIRNIEEEAFSMISARNRISVTGNLKKVVRRHNDPLRNSVSVLFPQS